MFFLLVQEVQAFVRITPEFRKYVILKHVYLNLILKKLNAPDTVNKISFENQGFELSFMLYPDIFLAKLDCLKIIENAKVCFCTTSPGLPYKLF